MLTVGAGNTNRRIRAIVKLGDGSKLLGESGYQPPKGRNITTKLPIAYPGSKGEKGCGLHTFKGVDVKGKIVLCGPEDETVASSKKAEFVKYKGGAMMIQLAGRGEGSMTLSNVYVLPTVYLNETDSQRIESYFNSDPNPTATVIYRGTRFLQGPAPKVASFSSRGPSLNIGHILKPDIIAPGENILAAWTHKPGPDGSPHEHSSTAFNFASGTSMSTPHVCGVAALLKKNHPDWSPAAIKSAIMTTADVHDRNGKPILDEKDNERASYFAMGAGHLNPNAANDPGLIYDLQASDYIAYLCGLGYTDDEVTEFTKTRTRCSKRQVISSRQLNYPSISLHLIDNRETRDVVKIRRTVTNVGEARATYQLQIVEPEGVRVTVRPTKLRFTRLNQKRSFNVTFSLKIPPKQDGYVEGRLTWTSRKYTVKSPISVKRITF